MTVTGVPSGSGGFNPNAETGYTYDNDGRLTLESGPAGTVQYVYETDGAGYTLLTTGT